MSLSFLFFFLKSSLSENYIASCSENKTIAVLNKQQVLGDKTGLNDSADNDIGYLYGHTDAVTCVRF